MYNQKNIFKPKIFIIVLLLGVFQVIAAQKLSSELNSKLSVSDQKKIQNAEEQYAKGKKIESDISPNTKDDKKSQLKWLEAADNYQNSNSIRNRVYADNIKTFWKKYTGEKNLLDFSKKIEVAANDSFKIAQQIRKASEKERKLTDRIRLLNQAEKIERKSLVMMQKVLFTYLSWPVDFDHVWVTSPAEDIPGAKKVVISESKDTIPKTKSDPISPTTVSKDQKVKETEIGKTGKTKDTSIVKNSEIKPTPSQVKTAKKPGEVLVGNDSSLYGKLKVSEDQIDKFNSFLEKKYPTKYEDYVINFQGLDYSDMDSLKKAWYKYQFGYVTPDSTTMVAALSDTTAKESKTIAGVTEKLNEKGQITDIGDKSKSAKPGDKQTKVVVNTSINPKIIKDKSGKTIQPEITTKNPILTEESTDVAVGFAFRVQIAACRVSLDEKTLHGIYNGSLKIVELNEDNWYKYVIGQFTTYKSARQLRDQSTIPGAFVIAYLNSKRIKITPALAYKKYASTAKIGNLNPALISYRIQIASSKINLSDNHLKNIYNGPLKIEVLKEDGWNKYYIPAGKTFQEAKNMLKQVGIPGAFILAYHQNTRIEISTATKLTK